MALTKIGTDGIKDDAVTSDKVPNAINSSIAANTAKDLTALSANNITSGTVPDARISASSVTQHVTPFSDDKIINDISALALKINGIQNATRYNTNSTSVETFQDSNGIATFTNTNIDSTGEYLSSISITDAYQSYTTNWHSASPAVVITQSSMGQHSSSRHDLLMDGSIITPSGNNSGAVSYTHLRAHET